MTGVEAVMNATEDALALADPVAATLAFYDAFEGEGVSYLQTRVYQRPLGALTPQSHWEAGGFIGRVARPDWPCSEGYRYICFTQNPLIEPVRTGRSKWRFGDYAPHDAQAFGQYWEIMREGGIGEAIGVIAHGGGGRIANIHLGLPERGADARRERRLWFAGAMLAERLLEIAAPTPAPSLTPRERDALAYVAAGKTDWEIGVILGVSETTARFHIDNARKKLSSATRAQAAAKLALAGLL